MLCLAMSNIALWKDGEETGTRRRKMKKGKREHTDAVLSWTAEIIKTLLCFIKHFKNNIIPVREKISRSLHRCICQKPSNTFTLRESSALFK